MPYRTFTLAELYLTVFENKVQRYKKTFRINVKMNILSEFRSFRRSGDNDH